jgi:asparagine synthase (glutamine-hydrolysing)
MCGIAGWVNTGTNLESSKDIIEHMTEKLAHRGPDACGYWISPHALLGHRRLIVVDPSGGSQPMIRKRGESTYVIVYNGELYNTVELRKQLESLGHSYKHLRYRGIAGIIHRMGTWLHRPYKRNLRHCCVG